MSDPLIIAGREFASRLFLGTAGYPNRKLMLDAIAASGTEMVTASIRRISLAGEEESLVDLIPKHIHFLPNTAGCQTAKDAVLTAELAREALDTNWIKLEVIGDRELQQIHDGTLAPFVAWRRQPVKVKRKSGKVWVKQVKTKTINLDLALVRRILNLAARKWRDILVLQGPLPADGAMTKTFENSVKKFGARIIANREFKSGTDPLSVG